MMNAIDRIKYEIENYANPNKDFEDGYVRGLMYALTAVQHGVAYADQKIDNGIRIDGKERKQ